MDTIVRIKWDKPEMREWLCPDNIKVALSQHCKNTNFEVVEVPSSKKVNESKEFSEIAEAVREQLIYIRHFDVEVEVITSALMFMKQNPKLTVSEALVEGFNDWVK